jgi:phosphomannomutase
MTDAYRITEEKCAQYLLEEPNPTLRAQIEQLLRSNTALGWQELFNRMDTYLQFGTAGLRGRMEAGYNRMNLVLVFRFAYALALEINEEKDKKRHIVVGYDGRLNSKEFAFEIADVVRSLGISVALFDQTIPTPICAYAVKHCEAKASVMVTASHNPGYDNGLKLFDEQGAQAFGSMLARIEKHMLQAPLRHQFLKMYENAPQKTLQSIGDDVVHHYMKDIETTKFFDNNELDHDINIVYTPLHGIGKKFFLKALRQEGFNHITLVEEQAEPDGKFPTVVFPNPEENHTLDFAHQLASVLKYDWVFANDPDADRLQVSCSDSAHNFIKLSGNEMGCILGYFALLKAKKKGISPLIASSIVSSRMLKAMCAKMNALYVDALTGFSNIIHAALEAEKKQGHQLVFAYEEAIGFLCGKVVLDKDGISAGARFMEIAGYLKKQKKTIWQLLDELFLEFGIFVNTQWSLRFDDSFAMASMQKFMSEVRMIPVEKIAKSLGQSECRKYDLQMIERDNDYETMQANVVIFEAKDRARLIVRPSGTEPKIKFYLETSEQASDQQSLWNKKRELNETVQKLRHNIENLFRDERGQDI